MQNPDFNEKRRNAETNDLIYEGIATAFCDGNIIPVLLRILKVLL